MEYVPGQDLKELIAEKGPLPPDQACNIIYQVAIALAEAYKHKVVHRDIKPSNIRVTPDGQAKLLDFGLVRRLHHRITDHGSMLGTVDYLAPEQASDASAVDIRADIFGLGATLFWCLTGKHPFPEHRFEAANLARRMNPEVAVVDSGDQSDSVRGTRCGRRTHDGRESGRSLSNAAGGDERALAFSQVGGQRQCFVLRPCTRRDGLKGDADRQATQNAPARPASSRRG